MTNMKHAAWGDRHVVRTHDGLVEFVNRMKAIWNVPNYDLELEVRFVRKGTGQRRTAVQNGALHLYLARLADALNESGLDQRAVMAKMKEGVEIPWSMATAKENLWRPIQEHMTGETSTTKLDKTQVGDVYDVLQRWIAQQFGVVVMFPHDEGL